MGYGREEVVGKMTCADLCKTPLCGTENCTIKNCDYGIIINNSENVFINGSIISMNLHHGTWVDGSSYLVLQWNEISHNGEFGLYSTYSHDINVTYNAFINNSHSHFNPGEHFKYRCIGLLC